MHAVEPLRTLMPVALRVLILNGEDFAGGFADCRRIVLHVGGLGRTRRLFEGRFSSCLRGIASSFPLIATLRSSRRATIYVRRAIVKPRS